MPRTLQKVFGRWVNGGWVGGGWSTVSLVFCFGPKLWFWTWDPDQDEQNQTTWQLKSNQCIKSYHGGTSSILYRISLDSLVALLGVFSVLEWSSDSLVLQVERAWIYHIISLLVNTHSFIHWSLRFFYKDVCFNMLRMALEWFFLPK